jgi:hypothetical protein
VKEAPGSTRKRLRTPWIITSMTGIMEGFTDKHCTACKSPNDRLRLRAHIQAAYFPDLGLSYYEFTHILGSSAENFATMFGGRVFGTVATFVCYSISVCQKNVQV